MSEHDVNLRNKKLRRIVVVSMSLLAMLVAGSLVFGFIERVREAVDRAH